MTNEQSTAMLHAIADIIEEYGSFVYDDTITAEEMDTILTESHHTKPVVRT